MARGERWWLTLTLLLGIPVPASGQDAYTFCAEAGERQELFAVPGVRSNRLAVVVGVKCYREAELFTLDSPDRDAIAVSESLNALGFDVVLLHGAVEAEDLLDELRSLAVTRRELELLVFYYAGHGGAEQTRGGLEPVLFTSETVPARPLETGLSVTKLTAALSSLQAEQRLFILDSCSPGPPTQRPSGVALESAWDVYATSSREAWLLAAPALGEAQEDISDAIRGGVYTHYLLRGLRERREDLDGDGLVSVWELHQWASAEATRYTDGVQHPVMLGEGQFSLYDLAGRAMLVVPPHDLRLEVRVHLLDTSESGDALVLTPGARVPVRPGPLSVEVWDTQSADAQFPIYQSTVTARAGQPVYIDTHLKTAERALAAAQGSLQVSASVGARRAIDDAQDLRFASPVAWGLRATVSAAPRPRLTPWAGVTADRSSGSLNQGGEVLNRRLSADLGVSLRRELSSPLGPIWASGGPQLRAGVDTRTVTRSDELITRATLVAAGVRGDVWASSAEASRLRVTVGAELMVEAVPIDEHIALNTLAALSLGARR